MLGRIFTVGGYTFLSRLTGFARDIVLAAILGAGPMADAFFVAFRLPNHFRAIFAEGAFNAAFVPAYAHVHGERGEGTAALFADRIFTLLLLSQLILLAVAWWFMPQAMSILAPGFTDDAEQRRLAIELTRITFPYLLLITLVTLYGGMLNVMQRFASATAACRGSPPPSSTTMSAPSSARWDRRRSARWGRRSRCLPTPSSRPFCRRAHSRRCIMPIVSTNCRSG